MADNTRETPELRKLRAEMLDQLRDVAMDKRYTDKLHPMDRIEALATVLGNMVGVTRLSNPNATAAANDKLTEYVAMVIAQGERQAQSAADASDVVQQLLRTVEETLGKKPN